MTSHLRTVLLCVGALAVVSDASAQTTALFLDSQPGDWVGGGIQQTYHTSDVTFDLTRNYKNGVSANLQGGPPSAFTFWYLDFGAFGQNALTPGTYGGARRFAFSPLNSIEVTGMGRGCNTITGRFVVLEAVYDSNGGVLQFAVDFEQHCENGNAALFGALRYNSSVSTLTPFGGDYPHLRLAVATPAHGTVTGGGLNCGASGTGCSIDVASPTTVAVTATPDAGYIFTGWLGDCFGAATTSVLVNGWKDCAAFFEPAAATPRTILWLDSQTGDTIGYGSRRIYSPANSVWTPSSASGTGVGITVDGASTQDDMWRLTFYPPTGAVLEAGTTYTHPTFYPTALTAGLEINSCTALTGRFTVLELLWATDGTLLRFAADFEAHCNDAAPGIYGAIRYNSTISATIPFGGSYPAYTITLTPPSNGTIAGDQGLACGLGGASCVAALAQPTSVALTATAAPGYIFAGWTGDCTGSASTATFVNGPKTCGALFEPIVDTSPRTLVQWTSQSIDYGLGVKTDAVGQGHDAVFSPAATAWQMSRSSDGRTIAATIVALSNMFTTTWQLTFGPPPGQTFTPGTLYVHASRFGAATPIMEVKSDSSMCSEPTGRFWVREVSFAGDGSVANLAIDFEQHCGLAVPALIGVIRYNSTISSLNPFEGDTAYRVRIAQPLHGHVSGSGLDCGTSTTTCVIVPGIASTPAISAIPDAEFAFAGWTGDCHGGSDIVLFVNGPKDCGALFEPAVPVSPRTRFRFTSAPGDPIGQGRSELYTPANSVWGVSAGGTNSLTVDVVGASDTSEQQWYVQVAAPMSQSLQIGTQYVVSSTSFSSTAPTMSVSGSQSCVGVGSFTIRQLVYGTLSSVQRLVVDFDYHCNTMTAPGITGTIEYNSTLDLGSIALDRTSLQFAIVRSSSGISVTSPQVVRVTQQGAAALAWTAVSSEPWLIVTPVSGNGSSALTVSIDPSSAPLAIGTIQGTVSIDALDNSSIAGPINVTLTTIAATAAAAPFGSFDTPTNGVTGVAGSIAVTGWALDLVQVTRVTVCRDAVAPEVAPVDPNCAGTARIYIGDAVFIDGARTDVQGIYSTLPLSSRAGWGYLLLTNFLPNRGNGTFNLRAYAFNAEGLNTPLGMKTITCNNAGSLAPFGAIDVPGQGAVTGGVVGNTGWVLAQAPNFADPPQGGTVNVFVDGINVGSPGLWNARPDLTALFPAAQYPGISQALGIFGLDTTTLPNGVHTIFWLVTGTGPSGTQGIGSRFFSVSNGAELVTPAAATASSSQAATVIASRSTLDIPHAAASRMASRQMLASEIAAAPPDLSAVQGRRGFDLDLPLRTYTPSSGAIDVQAEELDRIELHLSTTGNHHYTGYLQTPGGPRPLPVGSSLDGSTGMFTWMPGVGFYGTYHLTFVRWNDANAVARQDVRITLNAKGSNRIGPQTIIDAPRLGSNVGSPFFVGGWAADLDSTVDTGVNTVHVWAYPIEPSGNRLDPIFIGPASYGGGRPDVAAVYGERFGNSGYGIIVNGLAPGIYDIAVFGFSTVVNNFTPAAVVRVTVR